MTWRAFLDGATALRTSWSGQTLMRCGLTGKRSVRISSGAFERKTKTPAEEAPWAHCNFHNVRGSDCNLSPKLQSDF